MKVGDRVRVSEMQPDQWFTVTAVGRRAFLAVGVADDDPDHESTWMLDDNWQVAE